MRNLFAIALAVFVLSCNQQSTETIQELDQAEHYHAAVKNLTDIIVHDIFSPPVASRVYIYPNVAAYEILALSDSNYQSLSNQLRDLTPIPKPSSDVLYTCASLQAFCEVGKSLVFSESKMTEYQQKMHADWEQSGISKKTIDQSIQYGNEVANHILEWATEDNYDFSRTLGSYQVLNKPGTWTPTPPDFMDAIEPYWNQIKPFVIDSATQFKPLEPTPFDMEKSSQFYEELMVVYDAVKSNNPEHKTIAKFWDCNPFETHHQGHFMYGTKKISPGGHWIGITKIACEKDNLDFKQSAETYTLVSIGLTDAFISCWDEKYRSNLIRPETIINQYLDREWKPILQTPPFPEYTSGHSVVSASSATILTHLFGDQFAFIDSTEVEYGLGVRSFGSFYEAADEAAISRLYGGIHYMPAITNGVDQGKQIGQYVLDNIQTRVQ